MPEEKKGLDNTTIVFMIVVALFFDALQMLLAFIFMGWLVGIFAFLTFYVWFKMRGLSFATPKRATTFGLAAFIEMFPFLPLSVLPAWTAAIVALALDSKIKKVLPTSVQGTISPTSRVNNVIPFPNKKRGVTDAGSSTSNLKKAA